MDSVSESKLISLISQLLPLQVIWDKEWEPKVMSLIIQIISLVRYMDMDSQPKPESKLMSLVSQTVSLFNSMDLDSLPKPLSNLISLFSIKVLIDSDQKPNLGMLIEKTLWLKPDPELISLIRQIVSVVTIMNSKLISLHPQVEGCFDEGKFHVDGRVQRLGAITKWSCFIGDWQTFRLTGEDTIHFHCKDCNGEYHKEYEKAPLQIKHPLHRKHSLQLVLNSGSENRMCYCCDKMLSEIFYYCPACDYAVNIACVEKAPVVSIPHLKWHEHPLALFPRKTSLTCDVCALADSNSPFYICPPCDFVVHLKCINLPRLLRISRHPHRLCYIPSFDEGDWSCRVCRRNIDQDYGGYSCIRDGCSYAAHSRCATQSNLWDGIDLEGEPEETEEEEVAEPFERISDGIIRHFSHEHHHLRLDENTSRDYDDNKQCQACTTPIYYGNFYSCLQCEFVLHETCANLSRKIYHPIHPHLLTLDLLREHVDVEEYLNRCSVCAGLFTSGFSYECGKEECNFKVHVQCATISEPVVHASHKHPLFLTSKPEERRVCWVCRRDNFYTDIYETFNCIDDQCDGFALCFGCATIPQKVRYKHDKHILTLSYGLEETNTIMYWCEACEREIKREGFYMCDEYCCVTLHIECLIGRDLYMKYGSSYIYADRQVGVEFNNHHMSRPICFNCQTHCPQKVVFQCSGELFCSVDCVSVDSLESR